MLSTEEGMISRTPLRDDVYRAILDQIHRGDLPPTARVRDATVAAQLGVSRTPVREALLRLAREGVLEADAGRGFRVRRLDPLEIREVGTILRSLEALALSLSPLPGPEQLNRLAELDRRQEQTRGDPILCVDLDDEWHRTLLQECSNNRLLQLIGTLRQTPRRYLLAYLREGGRVTLSTSQHGKILDALRRGEREDAERLFLQHWRRGTEALEAWATRA
jgi:DNA-binding GntR family transcriptional regulator